MPYCRKCGTQLDPESKFCYNCGTPVTPTTTAPVYVRQPAIRKSSSVAAIILISILVFALVAAIVVFLPMHQVSFTQSNEASAANVNTLNLIVNADVANVNIMFKNLSGNQRATVNVTATGRRGMFSSEKPVSLAFEEKTMAQTLRYTVGINRTDKWNLFNNVQVSCEVYIDPSINLDLIVQTGTGGVSFITSSALTIDNLFLATTTGSVEATLTEKIIIAGPVEILTTTGSAQLHWNNTSASGNIPVNIKATTGSVTATISQNKQLSGNVTVDAETTTGGVVLALDIGSVGARIEASTGFLGGTSVDQTGFSGDAVPLQSGNYPAQSNFDIALRATTGGIQIEANYEPGISN